MKVSIITPIYNINTDLEIRTAKSILNQTNTNYEWIKVIDNTITTGYSTSFTDMLSKTKEIELNGNYGPSVARNVGFQVSDGDIIAYVDYGDILDVNRVDNLIKLYTEYPDTKLVFNAYTICQNDRSFFVNYVNFSPEAYLHALNSSNIAIPLGVSHTRDMFVLCGGFQRGIVCGEDGILWRRMSEILNRKHILFDNKNAGVYYVSDTGQSRTQRRFDNGGFAFDANNPHGSNGQYLDKDWFETYNSVKLFDN